MEVVSKDQLLKNAAIKLAKDKGVINLTRTEICKEANVPDGSFQMYTGKKFADFIEELKPFFPASAFAHKLTKSRASQQERRAAIMACALELAAEKGYLRVSPSDLADEAGVTRQSVINYVGTKAQLQRAIIRLAIARRNIPIIAQALSTKEEKIPDDLRAEALTYLAMNA